MSVIRPLVFAAVAAPLLAGAAFAAPPVASSTPEKVATIERIVAVVNAEIVLLSEAKDRAAQLGQPIDDHGTTLAEKRQAETALHTIVDRMVDDILVLQQAGELKLTVEESEVDRAVDEVQKQNKLDHDQFVHALSEQGYSIGTYRKDLRKQLLRLKVVNTAVRARINITDEVVKAFYEQSARQAGVHRQAHVRHVLVVVPEGADPKDIERRRGIAVRVLEQARAGEDFAALAKNYSDDASTKDTGGDLGWVKQGETDALGDVIFAMDEANEVRGPIRTGKGFEVVQLVEKKEGDLKPFAEAKEQIRNTLYQTQMEKQTTMWLAELKKKAHVEVRL
jgi:peptidyl-prolyl cis-trans isomerase SurA